MTKQNPFSTLYSTDVQQNLKRFPNREFVTYFSTYNLPSFLFVMQVIDCAVISV